MSVSDLPGAGPSGGMSVDGIVITSEPGIGAASDAAVVNPASSASLISLEKGELTELLLMKAGIGAVVDVAVVDPALSASVVALLKGILTQQLAIKADLATVKADIILLNTAMGTPADVAYVSGSGSLIAISKAQFAKV